MSAAQSSQSWENSVAKAGHWTRRARWCKKMCVISDRASREAEIGHGAGSGIRKTDMLTTNRGSSDWSDEIRSLFNCHRPRCVVSWSFASSERLTRQRFLQDQRQLKNRCQRRRNRNKVVRWGAFQQEVHTHSDAGGPTRVGYAQSPNGAGCHRRFHDATANK